MKKFLHSRGDTQANDAYTGEGGEITIDHEARELRVHDGATPGGHTMKSVNRHVGESDPHPQYAQASGFKHIAVVPVGGIPVPADPDTLYIEVNQ